MTAIYTTTHAGLTATRKSAGHMEQRYTHAVWVRGAGRNSAKGWECRSYAGCEAYAHQYARDFERGGAAETAVAPVTCEIKLTKKQKAFIASRAPTYPAVNSRGETVQVTIPND